MKTIVFPREISLIRPRFTMLLVQGTGGGGPTRVSIHLYPPSHSFFFTLIINHVYRTENSRLFPGGVTMAQSEGRAGGAVGVPDSFIANYRIIPGLYTGISIQCVGRRDDDFQANPVRMARRAGNMMPSEPASAHERYRLRARVPVRGSSQWARLETMSFDPIDPFANS